MCIAFAVAAGVVVFPIKPTSPNNTFRLLLTIAFFASAIYGLAMLLHPRERWMMARTKRRFADAPTRIEMLARKVVIREQAAYRSIATFAIATLGCAAVGVLASWPQFRVLSGFSGLAALGFVGCLLALIYVLVSGRSGWGAYAEAKGALDELMQSSDFKPGEGAPVYDKGDPVVASPGAIRAGNFDWRWDDFHKNAIIFGQTGTGKTVCVLNALLDGLLSSGGDPGEPPPGGLILDPKGDFRDKIAGLLARLGRADDLRIIDPDSPRGIHWNPLDSDDDELELAGRFAAVLEVLGTKNTQDTYWIDSAKKFLRHAIALLRFTNPPGTPPNFRDVARLAGNADAIDERLARLPVDDASLDVEPCLDFFEEWAGLGEKTRSSVQSQLTNMIDPFLMQPYRDVFGGGSTERIGDMVDAGRILYVHMPIADKQAMSRTVCTLVKLEYFREVLKRVDKKRQSFFICDEFQVFMTAGEGKGDSDFFERSRQSRHANIIACQNLPSLLKQTDNEKAVTNMLGNCAVKIFLRNTDQETNEFASTLFGETLMESVSLSSNSGRGIGKGNESRSVSSSMEYDREVRAEAFSRLAIPVRGEAEFCESIVHLGTRSQVEKQRLRWRIHPLRSN